MSPSFPFKASMVRAILAGQKTQTRRFLNARTKQPDRRVGDRVYVREAWRAPVVHDDLPPRQMPDGAPIHYEADGPAPPDFGRLRPGMFMMARSARIWLRIIDVRVEQLQDITPADAEAEGCCLCTCGSAAGHWFVENDHALLWADGAVECYAQLWNAINGDGAWNANPWIAAYTFEIITKGE